MTGLIFAAAAEKVVVFGLTDDSTFESTTRLSDQLSLKEQAAVDYQESENHSNKEKCTSKVGQISVSGNALYIQWGSILFFYEFIAKPYELRKVGEHFYTLENFFALQDYFFATQTTTKRGLYSSTVASFVTVKEVVVNSTFKMERWSKTLG
jgi:hypothetical protein